MQCTSFPNLFVWVDSHGRGSTLSLVCSLSVSLSIGPVHHRLQDGVRDSTHIWDSAHVHVHVRVSTHARDSACAGKPIVVWKPTHRIWKTTRVWKTTSCIVTITPQLGLGCCTVRLWVRYAQASSKILISDTWNRKASGIPIRLESKVGRVLVRPWLWCRCRWHRPQSRATAKMSVLMERVQHGINGEYNGWPLTHQCDRIFMGFGSGCAGCSPSPPSPPLSNMRSSGPANVSHRHRLQAHGMTAPRW
jgi:hypothetical protein